MNQKREVDTRTAQFEVWWAGVRRGRRVRGGGGRASLLDGERRGDKTSQVNGGRTRMFEIVDGIYGAGYWKSRQLRTDQLTTKARRSRRGGMLVLVLAS